LYPQALAYDSTGGTPVPPKNFSRQRLDQNQFVIVEMILEKFIAALPPLSFVPDGHPW
jgi:hypothetical protein